MDQPLIPADPVLVRQVIAREYLAAPRVTPELGAIWLAPHQVDAASRLLAMLDEHGGAVLADATGMGKTYVAIAVARLRSPAMIVAPASLRGMWRTSLGATDVPARVVSYEALSRGYSRGWEQPALLVLDEAHHARNPRTRRYAALADLAWGARVLLLSATPIHNRTRDLRALVALFTGSRAYSMTEDELHHLIVRRTAREWLTGAAGGSLPNLGRPEWLTVPSDRETLRAIEALPPAVPAADGGPAHALLLLGLIRAWSSSEAALRAMLKRRLQRAASLAAALEAGCLPDRRALASWPLIGDDVQLGFPEFFSGGTSAVDPGRVLPALDRHREGVRSIVSALDRLEGKADQARIRHLAWIRERHPSTPIVAFAQFADTANAAYRSCVSTGGVALVTGRGARIASGPVAFEEVVRGFDIVGSSSTAVRAMPMELLVATDVLSEGLSMRRAGVIVHLDLPWTIARLEQRVGRLRRLGSPFVQISIYAIGPPVTARELVMVIRALQRKARLSSRLAGQDQLHSTLPLVGQRLTNATAVLASRGESGAFEELRSALHSWANGNASLTATAENDDDGSLAAICLIGPEEHPRLLAIAGERLSERAADVLRVVRVLSGRSACPAQACIDEEASVFLESTRAIVDQWILEQRGREVVSPATEATSPAHVAVLRSLQDIVARATRSERGLLARRVEGCRQLVTAQRGAGAEMALARLRGPDGELDLAALEGLLESRRSVTRSVRGQTEVRAMLCVGSDRRLRAFMNARQQGV